VDEIEKAAVENVSQEAVSELREENMPISDSSTEPTYIVAAAPLADTIVDDSDIVAKAKSVEKVDLVQAPVIEIALGDVEEPSGGDNNMDSLRLPEQILAEEMEPIAEIVRTANIVDSHADRAGMVLVSGSALDSFDNGANNEFESSQIDNTPTGRGLSGESELGRFSPDICEASEPILETGNEAIENGAMDLSSDLDTGDIGLNRKLGAEGLHTEFSKQLRYVEEGKRESCVLILVVEISNETKHVQMTSHTDSHHITPHILDERDSTVVLVEGISNVLDEDLDISEISDGSAGTQSNRRNPKLSQPSYSEFFDTEKMNRCSIRLRTDLNEIMNSFTSGVDDELQVLRYSQEIERKNFQVPLKKGTQKCQIL
jgi:hypothetical protein